MSTKTETVNAAGLYVGYEFWAGRQTLRVTDIQPPPGSDPAFDRAEYYESAERSQARACELGPPRYVRQVTYEVTP